MIDVMQYSLMAIVVFIGIYKYCLLDVRRNRLNKILKHFKHTKGKVINCWAVEPKNGVPMYRYECRYRDAKGEIKTVRVRDNYDGQDYYGYSTETRMNIGDEVGVVYGKSEAYIVDDIKAEIKSLRFYYILDLVVTVLAILIIAIVRVIIKVKLNY